MFNLPEALNISGHWFLTGVICACVSQVKSDKCDKIPLTVAIVIIITDFGTRVPKPLEEYVQTVYCAVVAYDCFHPDSLT